MDVAYVPGDPVQGPGPLTRFLPPLEAGTVAGALESFGEHGDAVLDPFGASPRLAIEAAQAGRAVLVAVNNPITRYVLERQVNPVDMARMQSSLSRLAASPKDGDRLEPFLLDLYRTQCSRCGNWVSAEYFVWDGELEVPILRSYTCHHCNHTVEEPTSEEDHELALEHAERGLHHAIALEQVAPRGSPDRASADDALSVYPGRALFAIVTILNKLDQIDAHEEALPLLLSAFDEANALWGHPEGRRRPLQLKASNVFLEKNVWRALESSGGQWLSQDPGVELRRWSEGIALEPGVITLYPGSVRDLAARLPRGSVSRLVTVVPRLNQAFWTLSALWAAWLWGREGAEPIRAALRRRRYGWWWHSSALASTLKALSDAFSAQPTALGFIPDAEPGFMGATLAAFDRAGFELTGRALRVQEGQALLTWRWGGAPGPSLDTVRRMRAAAREALLARGEPAEYELVHAAAYSRLAGDRLLGNARETETRSPLGALNEQLDGVLGDKAAFEHHSRGVEAESGRYWPAGARSAAQPLADRIETFVLELLDPQKGIETVELDQRACRAFPGLLTPDRALVVHCLRSYATYRPEVGGWVLREEDWPESRAGDRRALTQMLSGIGRRLGYEVSGAEVVVWRDGDRRLSFRIDETARVSLIDADPDTVVVMPGGRAALVAEKARRNPLLAEWLASGPAIVKFRHIRRLAEDSTLDRENVIERLALDPPGQEDPQLQLL